jgi:diguanylate cyclase (GGDEF)-like protein
MTKTIVGAAQSHPPEASDMDDSILIVDDDPNAIQLMGHILSCVGKLRFALNGTDALRLAREAAPDLILLDAEMPGMSGFKLFEALKKEPGLNDVPVIFVTSHSETGFEVSALETGAADFIGKPVIPTLVLARVRTHLRVKRMADELRRIATNDSLTGVANRRRFDDSLEREWRNGLRTGDPISLLLVDVDHFKLYNDRYGHPKGDDCLRRVAQALASACRRATDLVARCGGEEFMVLLPQTSRNGAEHMARGVLETVEALRIFHQDSPTKPHVTVSVGIACYDDTSAWWEQPGAEHRFSDNSRARPAANSLVLAADKALYCAKRAGRAQAKFRDITDAETAETADVIAPRISARHERMGRSGDARPLSRGLR